MEKGEIEIVKEKVIASVKKRACIETKINE